MNKLLPIYLLALAAFRAEVQAPPAGVPSEGIAFEALLSGRRLQQAGQLQAARDVLLRGLSMAPDSAPLLDALGSVEQDKGEYAEAESLYLRAIAAAADSAGERMVALNNLGTLYLETAQHKKGDRIREQLQKLLPAILETHPIAAGMLLNVMGGLERARNRNDEAERDYVRSLQLFEQARQIAIRQTAIAKNNLGGIKLDAGRCDSAGDLFRQAIQEIESISGPENLAFVNPLINLARCENLGHRPQAAEPLARRAVELSTRLFGEKHRITATAMLEQAAALRRIGQKDMAGDLEKRAKAGLRTNSARNTTGYTINVNELARESLR
jgi:tetratricopeptide (TPR) repeat protein